MIASPNFPARSAAPFTMFAIPGVLGLMDILYVRGEALLSVRLQKGIIVLASLFVFASGVSTAVGYTQAYSDNKIRQYEIKSQLDAKQDEIIVSPFSLKANKYIYLADVQHNEKYWTNLILKRYYKVDSIVRTCDFEKSPFINDLLFFAKIGKPCS